MIKEKLKNLGQVLGCYFHQDWPDEFDSDQSALLEIIESEPNEKLRLAAQEISMLLDSNLSENDLRDVMVNMVGCYFEPISKGVSYEQWLMEVRDKFASR